MRKALLPIACTVVAATIAVGLMWWGRTPFADAPIPGAAPRWSTETPSFPPVGRGGVAEWGGVANVFGSVSSDPELDFTTALNAGNLSQMEAAYQRWMLVAPAKALRGAVLLPLEHRTRIQNRALALLADLDPVMFLRHADNLSGQLPAILAWLADGNPHAALRLLAQLPEADATTRQRQMAALLPRLVAVDPNLAARAITSEGNTLTLAQVQQVAAGYARKDLDLALRWASQVLTARSTSLGLSVDQALQDVTSSLVASAPEAAELLLSNTGDQAIRSLLVREIATHKARDDLIAGWSWLQQGGKTTESQGHAAEFLYRWSYVRPEQVGPLVLALEPTATQMDLAKNVAQVWKRKDPLAFESWVRTIPPGGVRDSVQAATQGLP